MTGYTARFIVRLNRRPRSGKKFSYEERVVLVAARNDEQAERIGIRNAKEYARDMEGEFLKPVHIFGLSYNFHPCFRGFPCFTYYWESDLPPREFMANHFPIETASR